MKYLIKELKKEFVMIELNIIIRYLFGIFVDMRIE